MAAEPVMKGRCDVRSSLLAAARGYRDSEPNARLLRPGAAFRHSDAVVQVRSGILVALMGNRGGGRCAARHTDAIRDFRATERVVRATRA